MNILYEVGEVFVVKDRNSLVVCDWRDRSQTRFPINIKGEWSHVREYADKKAGSAV